MPCEKYREALREAAAMGAKLPDDLLAHLQRCSSCEAIWNEERQLFAAMDAGVRRIANSEVPPSFLPRVRSAAEEIEITRRWSWMPAAAVVLAAAVIVAMVFVSGRTVKKEGRDPQTLSAQKHSIPAEASVKGTPSFEAPRGESAKPARAGNAIPKRNIAPGAEGATQVLVLVPRGEKESVDRILEALQRSKAERGVLSADKGEPIGAEQVLAPLAISPIEVKPLARVSEEATPENEKTKL